MVVYSCSPGAAKTTLQTGVSNYLAGAPADTKVALIDLSDRVSTAGLTTLGSATYKAIDGLHPYSMGAWDDWSCSCTKITSTMIAAAGAIYPTASQVLSGVTFGPNGTDFTGNVRATYSISSIECNWIWGIWSTNWNNYA